MKKAWPRGSTKDLSLSMLAVLNFGLVLWLVYGVLRSDWVIIIANAVGASLCGTVFGCEMRDVFMRS